MSWIRAGAALVSQTSSLLSMRALPAAAGARGLARGYAISAATAAVAAAAGGTTFRILGYKVPYSLIIGTSLAIGFGAYAYETLHLAREQDVPLQLVLHARPSIKALNLTAHDGRTIKADSLAGKHELLTFGAIKNDADIDGLNVTVRAAEAAKERTGAEVVPVFVSLDPEHDKPQQLAKIVQAAGSPSLLALTGDADGVLTAADKFMKQELARRMATMKDQEHYKKDDVYDQMGISDFIWLANAEGILVKLWPKTSPVTGIATDVAEYIRS